MEKTLLDYLDSPLFPEEETPSACPRPGDVLYGCFQVEKELTGGNVGRVYRCLHLPSGRRYALKTIDADPYLQPERVNLFHEEYSHWKALPSTPHILGIVSTIYDDRTNMPYFVMPYLQGHPVYGLTLRDWMNNGYRFTDTERLYLAISLSRVLHQAMRFSGQSQVPVHGDIKPDNIFLACTGSESLIEARLYLADCGRLGSTMAYFPYPLGREPDPASDLYALARMLRELENYRRDDPDDPDGESGTIARELTDDLLDHGRWKEHHLGWLYAFLLHNLPAIAPYFAALDEAETPSRSKLILQRTQDIYHLIIHDRGSDHLLDELIALRDEAARADYRMSDLPLSIFLDYYLFHAAKTAGLPALIRKHLALFRQAAESLDRGQLRLFSPEYSEDIRDELLIQQGLLETMDNRPEAALDCFARIKPESCFKLDWLRRYADLCPDHPHQVEALEETLARLEQDSAYADPAGSKHHLLAELYFLHGRLLRILGRPEEAAGLLCLCHEENPNHGECLYEYGLALVLSRQFTRARKPFGELYRKTLAIRRRSADREGTRYYNYVDNACWLFVSAGYLGKFDDLAGLWEEYGQMYGLFYSLSEQERREFTDRADRIREDQGKRKIILDAVGKISPDDLAAAEDDALLPVLCKNLCENTARVLDHFTGMPLDCLIRADLEVLLTAYSRLCDILLYNKQYHPVIALSEEMLSLWRDSETAFRYLWQAHEGLGSPAAQSYRREYEALLPFAAPDDGDNDDTE